jgi:hypothetical protein
VRDVRDVSYTTAGYRNGRPAVRPYVYRGADADMEEAIRERLAAVRAQLAAEPDPCDGGYEWRREAEAEHADPPQVTTPVAPSAPTSKPAAVSVAPQAPEPKPRCGYLVARCDCQRGVR